MRRGPLIVIVVFIAGANTECNNHVNRAGPLWLTLLSRYKSLPVYGIDNFIVHPSYVVGMRCTSVQCLYLRISAECNYCIASLQLL